MIIKNVKTLGTNNWQHKRDTIGEIVTELEDIEQCIDTICKTQKGKVVHNPNLGVPLMDFMDKPLNIVAKKIKRMFISELSYQEPRVTFNNVGLLAKPDGILNIKTGYIYEQIQHFKEVDIIWGIK